MLADYERLAMRSFDHPLDAEEQATMRVFGDALEATSDPRGALITLEYAIRDQPGRRHELARAINEHLIEHASTWLAGLAGFGQVPRALELEVRSGLLYGVFLDTRRLDKELLPTAVKAVFAAPFATTLRRLHVRVAKVSLVLADIATTEPRPPLEEIVVTSGARAMRFGTPTANVAIELAGLYPCLRHLEIDGGLASLHVSAPAFGPPSDAAQRTLLGRALTSSVVAVRVAALERLASFGRDGFAFSESLLALLGPHMPAPRAEVAACLGNYGEHARSAISALAIVTGRASHYDAETRHAAGVALAALRT